MKVMMSDRGRVLKLEQLLSQELYAELEELVLQPDFAEVILSDTLLNAARALRASRVVIFLTTLGVTNLPEPDDRALWLLCYQSIAQKTEVDGFQTLPENLPIKWVVRQIIGTVSGDLAQHDGIPLDWIEAIELSIDQGRLDLLYKIVLQLKSKNPDKNAWLAAAKILLDREKLIKNDPDLGFYAQSLELILDHLPLDEEHTSVHSTIASHAARCFLEVNESEKAKKLAMAIQPHDIIYEHERAVCMAEACCRSGEIEESIGWIEKILLMASHPEIIEKYQKKIAKGKKRQLTKPYFDPILAGHALNDLQKALNPTDQKVFLVSGTLLGYAREGKLLGHDKDIDVGIMGWINQFDVLNAIIQSKDFYVNAKDLGKENLYIIPIQHVATETSIDVFFYHHEGNKLVTGLNSQFGYLQKFAFTPFNLQPVEFLGAQIFVPDDVDLNLRENYGENWKTPDPEYVSHLESPSTVDPGGLIYQLVGRLNLYGAISRGKASQAIRILQTLEQHSHMPSGLSAELREALWQIVLRLDDLLAPVPEIELPVDA